MSWLPMFHDMGLIGKLVFSLYVQAELVLLPQQAVSSAPQAWLQAISRYRGTVSAAPNFAFQRCVEWIEPDALGGLRLDSWRAAFNGSEAVLPHTVRSFQSRFGPFGFRPQSMLPAYGLAEHTLACSVPTPGRPPQFREIDEPPAGPEASLVRRARCNVGHPLAGTELRVVDSASRVLSEGAVGEIELRGPCRMKGYFDNPEATSAALTPDGWLRTGDAGCVLGGELHIVGRTSTQIKKAGVRLDPCDIESAIGSLPGLRAARVAAFGVEHAGLGTQKLVVTVESHASAISIRELQSAVRHRILGEYGCAPDVVLVVRPGTLSVTTSGKVQHQRCRERFLDGSLGQTSGRV